MNGRNLTILNSIIEATAGSMSHSIYQGSLANMSLSGVSKGYNTVQNTQYARGYSKAITCGTSMCGSDERPIDEFCKRH